MRAARFLVGRAALLAALVECRRAPAPEVFEKAPVLLISIDTLRSDRLPAYGYRGVATPHLDRLLVANPRARQVGRVTLEAVGDRASAARYRR